MNVNLLNHDTKSSLSLYSLSSLSSSESVVFSSYLNMEPSHFLLTRVLCILYNLKLYARRFQKCKMKINLRNRQNT